MANMNEQPLMEFTSHVAGRNASVAIYPDRIEWARTGLGASLGLAPRRDTNMIPVRQIQGVSTHKGGLGYTTVRVATGGDATEFRVTKRHAEDVRATLLRLMSRPRPALGCLATLVATAQVYPSLTSCASSESCGTPGC
jgi:hypothetical protein